MGNGIAALLDSIAIQQWQENQTNEPLRDICEAVDAFRSLMLWIGSTPTSQSASHIKVVAALVVLHRSMFGSSSVHQIASKCGVSVHALNISITRFRRRLPAAAITKKTKIAGQNIAQGMQKTHAAKKMRASKSIPTPVKESIKPIGKAGDRRSRPTPKSA